MSKSRRHKQQRRSVEAGGVAARAPIATGWRVLSAFVASLLTYYSVSGGLFYRAQGAQIAIAVGMVAGLTIPGVGVSAIVAGAVLALGELTDLSPSIRYGAADDVHRWLAAIGIVVGGAAVAWVVRKAVGLWRGKAAWTVAALFVVLIIANLWVTALTLDAQHVDGVALFDKLSTRPAVDQMSDNDAYLHIYWLMHDGKSYYPAVRQAFIDNDRWQAEPPTTFDVREPAMYLIWQALPGGPPGIVVALLLLCSVAVLAAVLLATHFVRLPTALFCAGAVASYYLFDTMKTFAAYTEPWGSAIGLIAVACAVTSLVSASPRRWIGAGVALAVIAFLIRELMVFVLVGGLVASVFMKREDRWERVKWWSAAVVVAGIGYAFHAARAREIVARSGGAFHWLSPSLSNVVRALQFGTQLIGEGGWAPVMLALLGLFGALSLPDRDARIYLSITAVLPLAFFVFAANDAVNEQGVRINYWGTIIVPMLYAMAPLALARIPGVALSRGTARTRLP